MRKPNSKNAINDSYRFRGANGRVYRVSLTGDMVMQVYDTNPIATTTPIRKAKELILNEYNLFPTIEGIINGDIKQK